jgi:hypothetical protein
MKARMRGRGSKESDAVLVKHLHSPMGLYGKLEAAGQGYYLVEVEFARLMSRIGFTDARMQALAYVATLREQLSHSGGCIVGDIDGMSLRGRPRRTRDLESTFLSFLITPADEGWCDADMMKRFRLALQLADQESFQAQAGKDAREARQ